MEASRIDEPQTIARCEPRKSMFVLAMIYGPSGSTAVKIRDMSTRGALVEAPVIPTPGTKVRLCRGSLSISGEVVWQKEGRAGLLFQHTASVGEWLPAGPAPSPQQRADELFQQKRETRTGHASPLNAAPIVLGPGAVTALDLSKLRCAIECLAEDLSDDPAVVARHGSKLQTLDLAAQLLGKLSADR